MAVWDLFSKREKRRENAGQQEVYQYDDLPQHFRVQVIHIWTDALGKWILPDGISHQESSGWWHDIHRMFAREKGMFRLTEHTDDPYSSCNLYLLNAKTLDALDLIELAFCVVNTIVRRTDELLRSHLGLIHPNEAIAELNARFREHAIGYEFAGGQLVRIDSKFLHAEAVKPALQLLYGGGKLFRGPLDEFRRAHERHRKGEQKEAIVEALKAFESTMKAICTARGWNFDPHKDTASKLIEIVLSQGLVPSWLQGEFSALRSVLESGLPAVRNKTAGHGQGTTPTTVPAYLAAYALHLAAANIVLLVEAHKATP